jgi:hypothetical protein
MCPANSGTQRMGVTHHSITRAEHADMSYDHIWSGDSGRSILKPLAEAFMKEARARAAMTTGRWIACSNA